VDFVINWSPLLGALGAVALALLLVVGRSSLRRGALSLAVAAVVALLVELVAVFVALSMTLPGQSQFNPSNPVYLTALTIYRVSDTVVGLLAIAAWALLLSAAAQSGQRIRLFAFTLALTLALVVQLSLTNPQVRLLEWLREWALFYQNPHPQWAETLLFGLEHVAAVVALACAFFLPVAPSTLEAIPPALPTD
jgi:hypothetical protein